MADVAVVVLNYNGRALLPDCLGSLARLGAGYVWGELGYLAGRGQWGAMPYALLYEAVKSAGFAAGRSGHRLPLGLRRRLSLHQRYWLTHNA